MVPLSELIDRALRGTGGMPKRSQDELAIDLCCSQQAVSGYISGRNVPPDRKAGLFARVLGMTPDQVLATLRHDRALPLSERFARAAAYQQAAIDAQIAADASAP